jgi:hypothetical protein
MKNFRLSEMIEWLPYTVVTGTDCGTLQVGDSVRVESNGDLLCIQAGGWLPYAEWFDFDSQVSVKVDKSAIDRIKQEKAAIEQKLSSIENIVADL